MNHLLRAMFSTALVVGPLTAIGQDAAPASYKASPAVYKLIAENENFRVILATWKPHQRDDWHSHQPLVAYSLTGCESRIHTPNGKYVDRKTAKGAVSFNPVVASHSFENRSSAECQSLIVERKQ